VAWRGEKKAADRRLQSSGEIEIDSPEEGISDRMTGSTGWGEQGKCRLEV
jgi:hypothetical protein